MFRNIHRNFFPALALLLGLLSLGTPPAWADRTWDGGGDGHSWNDAANWDADGQPGTSDTLHITTNATIDNVYRDAGTSTYGDGGDTWQSATVNLNQGTITLDVEFNSGNGTFNIGDGNGTADAIVNVLTGGYWRFDRHPNGTQTINIKSDGQLNATGTGYLTTYPAHNGRTWVLNVQGGSVSTETDWNMSDGAGHDASQLNLSLGGTVNIGGAITVDEEVIDFADTTYCTFTADFGGSFTNITAVETALGSRFTSTGGKVLKAADNGNGSFTVGLSGLNWITPGVSNIGPTSADASATLIVSDGSNAVCWLYWDTSDKGESFTWSYTNSLATVSTGLVESTISGLTHATAYQARFYGTNSATTNFGWSEAIAFTTDTVIANSTVTDLTSTSATFNATLHAPSTNYDVLVYWGTSDGGAVEGSWGNTNYIGSYTNVASATQTFAAAGLTQDTEYHYTFRATNANDSFWATPSITFSTVSQPDINNGSGATPGVGYAALNGNLAAGTLADVYVYWGTIDGGTNTSDWANTNNLGTLSEGAFNTNATSLLYGETYYYRCYATNAVGEDWADSTDSFTTLWPVIDVYENGIDETVFDTVPANAQSEIESFRTAAQSIGASDGQGILTGHVHYNDDNAVSTRAAALGAVGFNDGDFSMLWTCDFTPNEDGAWGFRFNRVDDNASMWIDDDQNGTFEETADRFYNRGCCGGSGDQSTPSLLSGQTYKLGFIMSDTGGGGHFRDLEFKAPSGGWTDLDPGDGGQSGLWQALMSTSSPGITNAAASSLTTTSATLNATLEAPGSMFDVYVYWGTNDGGAAEGAWGNTNLLGTYTDVASTNLEFAVATLSQSTQYHYTFEARNDATNIWAAPSTTFTTVGQPGIDNATGATPGIGRAALNGELTAGSLADITVYWGTIDGGTNAADWANTNALGELAEGSFSTGTSTGLLYGVTYYYRCYATNTVGEDWADSTTNFTTIFPGPVPTNALHAYGYDINNDALAMDLNNNGGMMGGGDPTTFESFYSQALLTTGPGDRGLDFDNDGDFQGQGLIDQNDNFSTLFLGYLNAVTNGDYQFQRENDDDRMGFWLDLDKDGVFESTTPGLGSNRGEQLQWDGDNGVKTATLTEGQYLFAVTHREGGGGSGVDVNFKAPTMADFATIQPVTDPEQVGMWIAYTYTEPASIANMAVSDLTTTSATFNAALNATGSIFDVYVYWGTNDGGAAEGSWGNTNYVGSYTNDTSATPDFSTNGLILGQQYHYTFEARNQLTNLWASPSTTFRTIHQPAVNNSIGPVPAIGYATLNGELTSGSLADVHVYWGPVDGQTNATNWAHTNVLLTTAEVTFSTGTSTDLLYGVTYYYRCYASNEVGDTWADSTTNFTTLPPQLNVYSNNALRFYGYHINDDAVALNLNNNGGMMGGGDPTSFQNFYAETLLTAGPGNRGLDFNNDADFQNAGVIGQNDNYSTLFLGHLHAFTDGDYEFRRQQDDDACGIWLDLDQDGVFESTGALGSDLGEQLQWDNDGNTKTKTLTAGYYMFAVTHREGTAGSGIDVNFKAPSMGAEATIQPTTDPAQEGMWVILTKARSANIENTPASSLANTSATFNATLYGTQSVFDVYVYWDENDGGASEGSWANTNYVGTYTNAASNNLSFAAGGLIHGTEYHYTFLAQNDATNSWAAPSMTFATDTVIANSAATDLSTTSAVCNAVLKAPVNDYDVYLLWGDSDGGAADGAWANTNFVGSYTNVASTNISFAIGGLTNSTPYYYTFRAMEGSYTAWGHPSTRLYTHGLPAVQNLGATPANGYATLRGELLSAGGAPTTVHVYWGDTDGDTNNADWAYTNIISAPSEGVPFDTNTASSLLFGKQYYYRCYATNSNGIAWAESTVSFLTEPAPAGDVVVGINFRRVTGQTEMNAGDTAGVVVSQANWNNSDGAETGTTVNISSPVGAVIVDSAGLDTDLGIDWHFDTTWSANNAGNGDEELMTGYIDNTATGAGHVEPATLTISNINAISFDVYAYVGSDVNNRTGRIGIDGYDTYSFNTHSSGKTFPADYLRTTDTATAYPDANYAVWSNLTGEAFTMSHYRGNNNSGVHGIQVVMAVVGAGRIENDPVTESYPDYTMNGTLHATQAVFDVYLYWGESDGGAAPGAWANTNYIGSYTNTNGVSLAFTKSDLELGTTYHYTFMAQNLSTNIWASPSESFTTVGPEHILPFVETFEDRTLGDLDGQYGWVAVDTEVQGSVTHLGSSKAACMSINGATAMSHTFLDGQTDVWTDFYTKPVFGDPAGAGTPSEGSTAAFFVSTNGQVIVYDGTNQTELSHSPLAEGVDWVRFTVHSDYTDQEWDLYLNGQPMGIALDFYSTNTASYSKFGVMNTGTNNAYVDDINIQLTPPSFAGGTVILVR
ncbi:MAG: hypothetical protein QGH15_12745 [Kiritimatiellia bacterium]|jgi:hypothetical protein|nr:hypothetical protein [Kiritimatiellia bacterium]